MQIGSAKEIKRDVAAQKLFHSEGVAFEMLGFCSFEPKNRPRKSVHERLNNLVYDDDDIEDHPRGHPLQIIMEGT